MLNMDAMTGIGSVDGPMSPENYKRAVHRPPPSRFNVEMLPPSKQGSSFSFGMRICPIIRGDRSSTSSSGSSVSNSEYDIWRRWEDCLWFQDVVELEYSRMARQKKQRLLAGKGVKKNGFYKQDMASSWESLPPGPDPSSVAQDVHAYVPKLTKKGTLFRASQSTIDQRQKELTAFVTALFQENAPALLQELRSDRIVTDFFGYWRRDYDLAKKEEKPRSRERTSLTPSVLSSYFSPSSPAFNDSTSPQNSPTKSLTRRRALSATSSDSSSRSSNGSIISTTPGIAEDVPVVFDHNPLVTDRTASVLEALPEDRELASKEMRASRKPRSADHRNRNVSIYLSPDDLDNRSRIRESWQTTASASTYLEGLNMALPDGPDRERSRMSIASIATFMTDSSADAIIPRPFIAEVNARSGVRRSVSTNSRRRRSSILSDAYSDDEDGDVDSYLYDAFPTPSFHLPSPLVRRRALESRSTTPLGHHGETEIADDDNDSLSSSASTSPASPGGPATPNTPTFNLNVLPSSPRNSVSTQSISTITPRTWNFSPVPPSPTASVASSMGTRRSLDVESPAPSSPATTTFSLSTTESSPSKSGHITLKAAHNESIILLRISPQTSFAEVRHRIQDKFSSQEKVSLTDSFTVAIVVPVIRSPTPGARSRTRSTSLSSIGGQMMLILTQGDWERAIILNEGTKMTLRVLDTISTTF